MKLRALVSFSGVVSAYGGQVFEIKDKAIADDLVNAGYAELVAEAEKGGKKGNGGAPAPTAPPQTPPAGEEENKPDNAPKSDLPENNDGAGKEK